MSWFQAVLGAILLIAASAVSVADPADQVPSPPEIPAEGPASPPTAVPPSIPPSPRAGRPETWYLQASAGHSWVSAQQLEDTLRMLLELNREVFDENMVNLGSEGSASTSIRNTGGGMCLSAEAGRRLGGGWGAGLRFGSLSGVRVDGSCSGRGSGGETLDYRIDNSLRMVWVAPVLWLEGGRDWRYRAGMSAGMGWGNFKTDWDVAYDFKTPLLETYAERWSDDAKGRGLVLEFGAEGSRRVLKGVSLFAGVSYRAARTDKLELQQGTGDPELDSYLSNLEIDFGGLGVTGGVRVDL